jgi:F-type H+-transporting ATPase subunit b
MNTAEVIHAATVAPTLIEHEESFLGMGPPSIVALSMIVVILIMIWKKVPAIIAKGLDTKIATIRKQLDEAQALRNEAERLRADAKVKAEAAHADAQAILTYAKHEAEQIVATAKADADELIARRGRMAEDKIAAAERTAIAEVRAKAASAAAAAATALIAERHDASADKPLIDRTISGIAASRLN